MKENFSKRVQLIIKQSKEEAIRLGHSYVGSEHLLLGMLKEELESCIFLVQRKKEYIKFHMVSI